GGNGREASEVSLTCRSLEHLPLPVQDGAPGGIRTPDQWLRKPLLYPAELQARCRSLPGDATVVPVASTPSCEALKPHPAMGGRPGIMSSNRDGRPAGPCARRLARLKCNNRRAHRCHARDRAMPLHCVPRILLVVMLACPVAGIATPHPLDGLDLDEHRRAIALLRAAGELDGEAVVAGVHLIEPPKAQVLAAATGAPSGRRALVVLRRAGRVFEATVDLVVGGVRLAEVPGVQSQFTDRDYTIAAETALASAEVRALLAAHGVADPGTVDCFAAGSAIAVPAAARTMRVRCAERRGARSVAARVLEGVDVLVDVDAARVLHARDAGPSARTDAMADLDAAVIGPDRAPLPQDKAPLPAVHG